MITLFSFDICLSFSCRGRISSSRCWFGDGAPSSPVFREDSLAYWRSLFLGTSVRTASRDSCKQHTTTVIPTHCNFIISYCIDSNTRYTLQWYWYRNILYSWNGISLMDMFGYSQSHQLFHTDISHRCHVCRGSMMLAQAVAENET